MTQDAIAPGAVPVPERERIIAIDVLRGAAVLGILVMNIQSFSMIGAAYMNPTAYGDLEGANRVVWWLSHVLADQKFMTIFSLLFGAGLALMADRVEAAGGRPAGVHYRRTGWLILVGLLHAHLLWFGDILYFYGMCGLVVYPLRRLPIAVLVGLGIGCLIVPSAISMFAGWTMPSRPLENVSQQMEHWAPGAAAVATETEAYTGGWLAQMKHRVPTAVMFETMIFLVWGCWRAGGLMLIGIVLYRSGFLSGRSRPRTYVAVGGLGLLIGLPLVLTGVANNFEAGWTLEYSMLFGSQYNYWGSLFVSAAWIAVVLLASGWGRLAPLTGLLAAVGRMALTNYLLQTMICTTIFYGHGLGLFGRVERVGQIAIVAGVCVVSLVVSPLWLRRFRYGPFEWMWRSLTYGRRQPMRRGE